jgi:hypothetical protein
VRSLKTSFRLEKGRDRGEFAKGLSDPTRGRTLYKKITSLTSFGGSDGIQLLRVENISSRHVPGGVLARRDKLTPHNGSRMAAFSGRQRKPRLARVALTRP